MTTYTPSALWQTLPADIATQIENCLDAALGLREGNAPGYLFFRADDVAVPGKQFKRLLTLFKDFGVPLSLAIVPVWLTRMRWHELARLGGSAPELWCWHQHGWRHKNHAREGKKQEYGDQRSRTLQRAELSRGRQRLEDILEHHFYPAFTPPWNRCGDNALWALNTLGYKALSRSQGTLPAPPKGLLEFPVNVDLHTRKEAHCAESWTMFWQELNAALAGGQCGVMIHHQRMNEVAFQFLEQLLRALVRRKDLRLVHLRHLAESAA